VEHEDFLAFSEIIERQKMLEQYILRILKNQNDPLVQEVQQQGQQQQQPQPNVEVQREMEEKIIDEELDNDDESVMVPQPIIARKKKSWEDEVDDEEQAAEFEMMNQKSLEKKQQKIKPKPYDTVD